MRRSPWRFSPELSIIILFIIFFDANAARVGRMGKSDLPPQIDQWALLWKDDFDSFNSSKWEYQLYDGCQYGICNWGNAEMVRQSKNCDCFS